MMSKRFKRILKQNAVGYMFMLPLILGLAIFTVSPIIQSLVYSFFKYDGLMTFEYIGTANYQNLFTVDPDFWKVMGNTFIFAPVSMVLSITLTYFLALFVNKKVKGVTAFRVLYYFPVVIPGVVSGVMWVDILSYPDGAFNTILNYLGVAPWTFFNSSKTSMLSIFMMQIWGAGGGMILWLAAFKNIPKDLYEATSIDGAGKLRQFFVITLPMSTPMIFYHLITGIIGSLQYNGTMVFAPRDGKGIGDSIFFITVKIYKDAFESMRFGYASAMSWVLFAAIAVLVALVFITSRWVFYGDE